MPRLTNRAFYGVLGVSAPSFFITPLISGWKGVFGDYPGSGTAGTGTRGAGIDGWDAGSDRDFFYFFFPRARFFYDKMQSGSFVKSFPESGTETSHFF